MAQDENMQNMEDPTAARAEEMRRKREEQMAREQEERDQHQLAMAVEAEAKGGELGELLAQLTKPQQFQVRLEAAILARESHGQYGNQRQIRTDDIALELARYAVTGKVDRIAAAETVDA